MTAAPPKLGPFDLERVFRAVEKITERLNRATATLDAAGIPYAVIGAFALNEYGHRRVTVDVDVLMRDEDLQQFKRRHLGRGYTERVPGTGKLLDTQHGVNVGVLSAREVGDYAIPLSPRGHEQALATGRLLGTEFVRSAVICRGAADP